MESKIVSRGTGRSVVAASAYMSCSRLYNDYDGVQHDYTRKQGLIWQDVFLPPQAPQEWRDRERLWNAVEANEKTKDSRLAREIIVALLVGLVCGGIFFGIINARYKMKTGTYTYPFREKGKIQLIRRDDIFVNQTVTRRRIERDPPSGGGGRSSVHTSGSGRSHGGGGRSL